MISAQTFNLKQLNSPLQDALKPTQLLHHVHPRLENTTTLTALSWGYTQCSGKSGKAPCMSHFGAGEAVAEVSDYPGQAALG